MATKKSSSSFINLFIILGLIIGASYVFVGGFNPLPHNPPADTTTYQLKDSNIPAAEKSLQLRTPIVITPTPLPTITAQPTQPATPVNICPVDDCLPLSDTACHCLRFRVVCQNHKCVGAINGGNKDHPVGCGKDFDDICQLCSSGAIETFCIGKPVIYLYPTKKTLVDVSVETSGEIVVSDPLYPEGGGWKDVLAYPDGRLEYQNKSYRELFYESNVSDIKKPENGIIVSPKNIKSTLEDLTTKLGLIPYEQKELVDFWTPKLEGLKSPYILISLINKEEKDRTDKVNISPKPDTMINFILYFKPLDKSTDIKPLVLPPTSKRAGFTAVEWGGTIDYGK